MNKNLSKAFSEGQLGDLTLRNRFIKSATYEGKTPEGVPNDALLEFHRDIAEGGVAMTTIAYCSTEADGRGNGVGNMYMHDGIREPMRDVVSALKKTGARVSGQMVHCGNFTRNNRLQRSWLPRGPSLSFNLYGMLKGIPFATPMKKAHIDHLIGTFRDGAAFMKEVGFDAVEIHAGHGYAISQFISPFSNRRDDEYGGSLRNRMRLPLQVIESVREAVGSGFPIIVKMGLYDGIKKGLKIDEAVEVASMFDETGAVDALVCSGGTSSFNGALIFRGDSIGPGMAEQERNPVAKLGLRILGPYIFRTYPYEELYFLDGAKRVRDRVKNSKMIYIGGCSTMASIETVMKEGFDFIEMGRALIKDANFVNNAQKDPNYVNGCIHCNRCVPLIDAPGGVRCPLNDEQEQAPAA